MSTYYRWYGLDSDEGNDICISLVGGIAYFASIHEGKYPKAASPFWHYGSEHRALKAGRKKLRRYLKGGGMVADRGWTATT